MVKYLEKSKVGVIETESSSEECSNGVQKSEKEIKLRTSEDYEIHTITEESEQVTQTDFKQMTPTTFSSKPITPNKRYSSNHESGSEYQK